MPFGLTNAPATFQRMMNETLAPFIDKFVVVYLDDILIFSRSEEEHKQHVREVLQTLREAKLYCKRSKCDFGMTEVEYLGHFVGLDGIRMDNHKVEAVTKWPAPKGIKELRSFLGLAGYYQRFIDHYVTRVKPMSELLKQDVPWNWGKEQQESFENLKTTMTSAPVLAIPDPMLPYEVFTDSSAIGVGGVLLQDQGRGWQPCAYLSHKLSNAERNYKTHEQELLGTIHALKVWRPYLEGAKFKVNSDHQSLMELATQPKLSRRQARWVEFLQAYDCNVEYVPGERNQADALSRRPDLQENADSESQRYFGAKGPAQSAAVHGTSCARCATGSARSAPSCGALGTSRARSDKLRSSGDSAARFARPAQLSRVSGTSRARGAKLRSSGDIDQVDLMHISVLNEDSSFRELVRQTTEADAYPSKDRRLSTREGV